MSEDKLEKNIKRLKSISFTDKVALFMVAVILDIFIVFISLSQNSFEFFSNRVNKPETRGRKKNKLD